MAGGAFSELCSAVPSWRYSLLRRCRPAPEARHRRDGRPSHRAERARRRRLPLLAARLAAPPLAARPVPRRKAPLRLKPLRRPVTIRPVPARHRRARPLTRLPPSPRAPAAAGRPVSSTRCCSASAYWRSWPVRGASPTGDGSCGSADLLATAGLADGLDEDAASLLDQHRHLVTDGVEVRGGGGEHGEA